MNTAEIEFLRDVDMATNFGTTIAINWLSVNDGDSAIGYGGKFEWSWTECRCCRYPAHMGRCYGNQFLG